MEGRDRGRRTDVPAESTRGVQAGGDIHITIRDSEVARLQIGTGNRTSPGEGRSHRPAEPTKADSVNLWLTLFVASGGWMAATLAVADRLPESVFWPAMIAAASVGAVSLGVAGGKALHLAFPLSPRPLTTMIAWVFAVVLFILNGMGLLATKPLLVPPPSPLLSAHSPSPTATVARPTPTPAPMALGAIKTSNVVCNGPVHKGAVQLAGVTIPDSIYFDAGTAMCGDGADFALPQAYSTLEATIGTTATRGSMRFQVLADDIDLFNQTMAAGARPVRISCDIRGAQLLKLRVSYPSPRPNPDAYAIFGRVELSAALPPMPGQCL